MRRAILSGMVVIGLCIASPVAFAAGLSSEEIEDGFIGKPFTWKHKSGVGGATIHNADGSMVYDANGKERTAKWAIKEKTFCVNVGEKDEWCFTLVRDGDAFKSDDGSIVYTPR